MGPPASPAAPTGFGRALSYLAVLLAVPILGSVLAAAQDDPARSAAATDPGPRARVGGLLALQARSVVHFHVPAGTPAPAPHQLVATFAFPDRARWRLEPLAGRPGGRRIVYRFGATTWVLEADQPHSRRLAGDEATDLLGALELRRAWMLWPHGAPWTGSGEERRAELPGGRSLVARLESGAERPGSIECRDADGTVLERFAGKEWIRLEGRSFPARFEFEVRGQPVWREELVEVELDVRHVDAFFQPHDVRPAPSSGASRPPLLVEVARQHVRRVELPETCDWETAQRRFSTLLAEESVRLAPLTLDGSLRAEVDGSGVPIALLLVLTGAAPAELPTGYRAEAAGSALAVLVDEPPEIDAGLLRELGRALPEGASAAGPARVRVRPRNAQGPRAQVLLPLAP